MNINISINNKNITVFLPMEKLSDVIITVDDDNISVNVHEPMKIEDPWGFSGTDLEDEILSDEYEIDLLDEDEESDDEGLINWSREREYYEE